MRNLARVLAAGTTSCVLVSLLPSVAFAAASRTAETPTAGSAIATKPATISATFAGESILSAPAPTLDLVPPAGETDFDCGAASIAGDGSTLACTTNGNPADDGVYTVTYSFSSVPGGPTSGSFTFTLDTVQPALASTSPANAGTVRPKTSNTPTGYTATANETLKSTSTIVIKDSAATAVPLASTTTTGSSVKATPSTPLTPGSYTAEITLVDLAGNSTSPPARSFSVTAMPAPTGLTITPDPYTASRAASSTPVSVTGKSAAAGDSVLVTLASSAPGSATLSQTVQSTAGGNFGASFSNSIADGTLTATAKATDADGNESDLATDTAEKDTVVPSVQATFPDSNASQTSAANFASGYTATASEILGSTSSIVITKGGVTVATNKSFPQDNQVQARPVDLLTEGTYNAAITLVDLRGNTGTVVNRTFAIDNTAPNPPSFDPVPTVINKANQAAYPVSGTGEPGAAVNLSITDGATTVSGTATVTGGGTWTITRDASSLADGTNTIQLSLTQTDAAGNTSPPATASTTKDTVAPRVSAVAFDRPSYNASHTSATISGLVDSGSGAVGANPQQCANVQVTVKDSASGSRTGQGSCLANGTFSVVVSGLSVLADGPLTAEVLAFDGAGNSSAKALSSSPATKDTGNPATPTVTVTNPINAANQSIVVVSGATDPGVSVLVTINDGNSATSAVTKTVTSDGSGVYEASGLNVSSLDDGTLTVSVVATDAAENASAAGTATTTKDTEAPAATTLTSPTHVSDATKAAVPLSGSMAEGLGKVAVSIDDTNGATGPVTTLVSVGSNGAWSTSVDVSSLSDGNLTVTAEARDAAGNPGTSAIQPMVKDTVAPGTPTVTTTPVKLDYANRAADLVVSGTTPADTGAAPLEALITVSDSGSGTMSAVAPVSANAYTHTFSNADLLALADGTLTVLVKLRDAAGNTSTSALVQVVKDVTKLVITSTTPAAPWSVQSVPVISVTFNDAVVTGTSAAAPPYSSITLKKGGVTLAGSHTFTNGSKTMTFTPGSTLNDGVYDVFVHATDANDSGDKIEDDLGTTPTFSFTVDNVAPVAPSIGAVTNPVNSLNQSGVSVSGNATESGLTVLVTITGTSGSVSKSAVSGTSGAFSVTGLDVSSLPDGQLTAVARSTDAAGNQGPSGGTATTTKDAVAPTVTGLAATATRYGNLITTVTGTVSETSSVVLSATDGTATASGPATVAANRTFRGTLDLSGFKTGPVTVTARATDVVGNTGSASTTTTHDAATPPATPGAPTAAAGDRSARVFFGAPASNGGAPITSYTVVASNGRTATGTGSPITVTGLTNGAIYTFRVKATNRAGSSPLSAAGNAVRPMGRTTLAINALPSRVIYGTAITVSGKITRTDRSVAVGSVRLRARYDNGALVTLRTLTPASDGTVRSTFKPAYNWTYHLFYAGDAKNTSAVSTLRRTLVSARVTASAPTGSRTINQVITGAVGPNKAAKTVYLYRVTSTGSLVKLGAATLSSSSTYRFSVRLPAGYTRLRVLIPATTNNASGWVTFTARRT